MFDKKKKDYRVIKNWKKDMTLLIKKKYPHLKNAQIDDILMDMLLKNFKTDQVSIVNNYTKQNLITDTLGLTEFIDRKKYLVGGNGVLFDDNIFNPAVPMLEGQASNRKAYKKKRDSYDKDVFEYSFFDLKQNNEKVVMNAWYGIAGQPASHIFNIYCATGITFKGKELISVASSTFEAFISGNFKFINMDDCLIFIKNCIKDAKKVKNDSKDFITRHANIRDVLKRLGNNFFEKEDFDKRNIMSILLNCNQTELDLMYYKNNLIEFCDKNYKVKNIIHDISFSTNKYNSPNENDAPESMILLVNILWDILNDYVYYNHIYVEKIYKTKYKERHSVVLIDTDSNMITVKKYVDFVMNRVLTPEELEERNNTCDNFRNICIYSFTIILSRLIKQMLLTFLKKCNVNKKKRYYIDMKNEYLFSRILITNVKKAYATLIDYKEGKFMDSKLDVKGLAIRKSSTNRSVSKQFKDILENDILKAKNINSVKILEKVDKIQNKIKKSLLAGETKYLKPAKLNDINAYEDILKNQPYRGMMIWNLLYPDKEIVTPATFSIIKMKLIKKSDLSKLYNCNEHPKESKRIAELLEKYIFDNPEKRISSKGVYVVAIPHDVKMPYWFKYYIDVDQTVDDNLSAIMPILESLEFNTIKATNKNDHFSNYITL